MQWNVVADRAMRTVLSLRECAWPIARWTLVSGCVWPLGRRTLVRSRFSWSFRLQALRTYETRRMRMQGLVRLEVISARA